MHPCFYDETSWLPCPYCETRPQSCPYRDPTSEEYREQVEEVRRADNSQREHQQSRRTNWPDTLIPPIMCEADRGLPERDIRFRTVRTITKAAKTPAEAIWSPAKMDKGHNPFLAGTVKARHPLLQGNLEEQLPRINWG